MQPYSDDLMRYDELSGMYILTEKALADRGFDISFRLASNKAPNATQIINGFLLTVSELVYEYIHEHNIENTMQDRLIACVPGMRMVMFRALMAQAAYMYQNGDLSLSTESDDIGKEISPRTKRELNTTIPELGTCILYTGRLDRWTCLIC